MNVFASYPPHAGNVKPEYRLNQFGSAGGGPVVKNRTFFFVDYQGTRQRTGQTFLSTIAPIPWRTGDFSGFNPILDPLISIGADLTRCAMRSHRCC